jgi:hypothetical protein
MSLLHQTDVYQGSNEKADRKHSGYGTRSVDNSIVWLPGLGDRGSMLRRRTRPGDYHGQA